MKTSLRKKTLRAGLWLFIRKLVVKFINLAAIYVLARKLTPYDFGIVALAQVALRFVSGGVSQTTGAFVIYDNSKNWKEKVNAAFWLNLLLVFIFSIFIYFTASLIAKLYNNKSLEYILKSFIIYFVFMELSSIPDALIKKQLDYNKLVLRDTVLDVFAALMSVFMAIYGYGVWSLVIPQIVSSIMRFPVSLFQARWFPSFPSLYRWNEIFRYSFHIMGSNFLTLLGNEGDTLITGKLLGFSKLGIYNRAYASANLIVKNIKSVVTDVSFPALSSVNTDKDKLKKAYLKMLRMLAFIGFPMTIGLIVVAKEFILTLYGPKWEAAIVPMQILAIMALRRLVGSPAGMFFNAIGKPDIMFKFGVIFTPVYLVSVGIGALYGIIGVAIAVTLSRTVGGLVIFYLNAKELQIPYIEFLSTFFSPFLYSSVMGGFIIVFKYLIHPDSIALSLILYVFIGVAVYIVLSFKEVHRYISELV